ncbi:uroporphyrinogen-III synthase [Aeromonas caviae]|jgi:uroporphyrinogen-III synthase|uniref:uroporphyrinogen-III synthase n=1 Tax=Aeromonas TaxID=642 RepID=UPI000CD18444|nr:MULTISPECIES: uroporphyrinogen-III synthase [Aeromonas]AUT42351.1 uroporphyrinogen III synthase [Aeromonas sp. ASNIH5]AUV17283.1 uroporphyrinogen III synthase [Aeromonas sp. ASNIH7]MBL0517899.1 uroporphyrinogen-III synthase [Aeromonas caviae]MDH0309028.1 uroporphyrinogen-III synthase [Aeromonas caviae]MDM5110897.1 uroporphyrinogen-III synthase [Aeromonas caviae]
MIPLVVRPAAQANQLVQMLRQLGHAPLCCPLLETRPGCDLPHLGDMLREADLVIAVSMHAVHFAHYFLLQTGQTWPHIDYFAVGQASADAFAEAGIQALCPADPRSEGLLALPALQGVSGRRVLILRGNDGRDLIARTLASRGALVHYCATYERHYPDLDGDALTRHWQAAGLDSLLITSGELLQRLLALVPGPQHPWLYDRLLVVPSPRVAEMAEGAGFTRIVIAQGASNQALVAALELRKME